MEKAPLVVAVTALQLLADLCFGLRVTNMTAPALQDPRQDMELMCRFDIGGEDLYAVKWYKDDQEFFRYSPTDGIIQFSVPGVYVDSANSGCTLQGCNLLLKKLARPHSTGAYRCEVSTEAPAFRLAAQTHFVTVAAVPQSIPRITGLSETYPLGHWITANCTSDLGDPKPTLKWSINKQPADLKHVHHDNVSSSQLFDERILLQSAFSQLHFLADRKLTQNRAKTNLEITCESSVGNVTAAVWRPLAASKMLVVLDQNQIVNNQKLHSPYSGGAGLRERLAVVAAIVVAGRWC